MSKTKLPKKTEWVPRSIFEKTPSSLTVAKVEQIGDVWVVVFGYRGKGQPRAYTQWWAVDLVGADKNPRFNTQEEAIAHTVMLKLQEKIDEIL